MPIFRLTQQDDAEQEPSVEVFHIQEAIEVYDSSLALAIDHLLNHIKVLVSLAYLPETADLEKALKRHPELRRLTRDSKWNLESLGGRTPDRLLFNECQILMERVVEIAHLAAWPETAEQAATELELLQQEVPFLDFRYDHDPFPSDGDHEEPGKF
jgi:hypothetical protein